MPELPEVEVSRQGISPYFEQATIAKVIVRNGKLRWPIPDEVKALKQKPVLGVSRRAKYLLIELDSGSVILHLGMSGSLRVIDATTPVEKHDHVDIVLTSGKCLRLNDPRRFGAVLWQPADEEHSVFANLGPEPLSDDFNAQVLIDACARRKACIKQVIMDNKVVVGVGNIYANESLFLAGIRPDKPANKLSRPKLIRLTEIVKQVLARAITQGGTTLKDFSQVDGKPGYFAQELYVYGRAGEACPQCDNSIKEQMIGQRNTFYCTQCQK